MRIFHEDVLLLKAYCKEFYDGVSALQNNGFLALIAPEYIPFGTKVMEVIRRVVTMHRMRSEGMNSLKSCKDELLIRRQEILDAFEGCCPQTKRISTATKRYAVFFIIEKTCNAYHGCVLKQAKEKLTKRGGKHYVPNCLRVHLRSISERSKPSEPAEIVGRL
jgi:hypothetical protein